MLKQAIMSAFPVLSHNFNEEGYTPDNIESSLLQQQRLYTRMAENEGWDETPGDISLSSILTNASSAILQTANM